TLLEDDRRGCPQQGDYPSGPNAFGITSPPVSFPVWCILESHNSFLLSADPKDLSRRVRVASLRGSGLSTILLFIVALTEVFNRRPLAEGVGLRVTDFHTGNHLKDDFTPLKTIQRSYSVIREKIPFELEGETFKPERRILNITNSERPPVTTTVFVVTTPENTPFAYHASTFTNHNPTISLAFVESKMVLRPEPRREATPTLRLRSLGSADNKKELWDSRMHQTGKETGGEVIPKALGLQRLKQGKVKIRGRIFPHFWRLTWEEMKIVTPTVIFNLRTGRPSAFD
nr:hypothetical protein [Tanacetum cinerariifolium]